MVTPTKMSLYSLYHLSLIVDEVTRADINLPPRKLKPNGCVGIIEVPIVVLFNLWWSNLFSLFQPI